jgi:hypothetical protein
LSQSCVVRKAKVEDIEWLVAESEEFAKFFDAKISLYNPEHLSHVFGVLIDSHLIFVAEVRGERSGFIAGLYTSHFLNPHITTLTELLYWVSPKFRGSRSALMLLNAFDEWGAEHADWVLMTIEDKSPMKDETLFKRGFRHKENCFIKEIGV